MGNLTCGPYDPCEGLCIPDEKDMPEQLEAVKICQYCEGTLILCNLRRALGPTAASPSVSENYLTLYRSAHVSMQMATLFADSVTNRLWPRLRSLVLSWMASLRLDRPDPGPERSLPIFTTPNSYFLTLVLAIFVCIKRI